MSPARYLLDARPLQDRSSVRGIGRYVRGLLDGMIELGVDDRFELILPGRGRAPEGIGNAHSGGRLPVLKRRIQPLVDPFLLSRLVRRSSAPLYHGTEWVQPILRSGRCTVVTVHDLIPFLFPQEHVWLRRERLLAMRLLRRADAVIAVSAATAADTVRIAGVDPDRVHVVHHGVGSGFAPVDPGRARATLARLGIPADRPLLLAVGVFDPRKRMDLLVAVAARVTAETGSHLVIAGAQGVYGTPLRNALARGGIGPTSSLLGYVSDEELRCLYGSAACLVFTSAYEGFGLPVLEAMACGCPVVAFDNSAFPEVTGDAGMVVPDGDADAMATAVTALISDAAGRPALVTAGREWSARFSWRRCAWRTLAVYSTLLGGGQVPEGAAETLW